VLVLGDRYHAELDGGEPDREGARVGLDEVGEQPLHRADQAAVHHHRPGPPARRVGVGEVEPRGLVEVDLDGRDGPLATGRVRDLYVDLRAVERRLAPGNRVGDPGRVEGLPQQQLGPRPCGVVADVLAAWAAYRQLVGRDLQAQRRVGPAHQPQYPGNLLADLGQGAEDVRVVEPYPAYPAQPAEYPRPFGAVHAAQLGDAQRELPVRALAGLEDECVVRAQAGPQYQRLVALAEVHRREHVAGEVGPVAGQLVQLPLAEYRRVDVLVPAAPLQLAQVGLHLVTGRRAGR
jgi:hypothetical protein